jgi:peptidoglycan biosynthesis protein MviN/MurJ (putative lipid II flippase)
MKTSPEAIALACFTLVFAILIGGWQQIAMLSVGLVSRFSPVHGPTGDALIVAATVSVVVIVAAVAARTAGAVTTGWPKVLGDATVILAVLVVLAAVALVLGSVARDGLAPWGRYFG